MHQDLSDSSEEKDVKPLLVPVGDMSCLDFSSNFSGGPKKWSPGSWQDENRKSAFQPYKQQTKPCTVLTNLQRGNTQAATPVPQPTDINFHTRAGQGEITKVDIRKEKSVDICDGNGLTALHWAASYGQINAVKLLVEHGAEINKVGPDGESPLLLGASGGHHDVVRYLLKEGAVVNHVDDMGNTALMFAASGNHPHTCNELLSQGADISLTNLSDDTAFNLAVDNQSNLGKYSTVVKIGDKPYIYVNVRHKPSLRTIYWNYSSLHPLENKLVQSLGNLTLSIKFVTGVFLNFALKLALKVYCKQTSNRLNLIFVSLREKYKEFDVEVAFKHLKTFLTLLTRRTTFLSSNLIFVLIFGKTFVCNYDCK